MRTFVDTSALYALLDEDDGNNASADRWLSGPGSHPAEILVSHNYVVVETAALVHRRLGPAATRVLFQAFIPALSILYVDEDLHQRAAVGFLAALGRSLSFVDWVSFQLMREMNLQQAFAFDRDFGNEGFRVVP